MGKMKAVRIDKPTKAEDIVLTECEIPKVRPEWVLLKVMAFGMNHSEQILRREEILEDYIQKPVIPDQIGNYTTRFEAFKGIIEHVSYGTNNSITYVEGHKDALEKYFKDAYNNSKDLYVIEARVNDEINRYNTHNQVYEIGRAHV